MSLILSGSDGISDIDGSAATPAIRGTDANTGIFFPAADTIAFAEGGTEVMRIDSSANVGIGTSSPVGKLNVYDATNAVLSVDGDSTTNIRAARYSSDITAPALVMRKTRGTFAAQAAVATSDVAGNLNYQAYDGATVRTIGQIQGIVENYTAADNLSCSLIFATRPSGAAGVLAERMRITSAGNLRVNTTSTVGATISTKALSGGVAFAAQSEDGSSAILVSNTSGTANYNAMVIYNNSPFGTVVGSINCSGSTTNFNTTSDYRLKENIAPMTGALAKVTALKPVTYKWKVDGSDGQGFIAHELQAVVPDCVTGDKDAVETYTDEDGNEQTRIKPQGIDTSFLVATLTAAIQELKATVDEQAARIAALEAAE